MQVTETRKRVYGLQHLGTLISMDNLASIYMEQGRLKEAEMMFTQVMETSSRLLGQQHPETLTCMGNLALIYKDQG
jgi:hypothetical protein